MDIAIAAERGKKKLHTPRYLNVALSRKRRLRLSNITVNNRKTGTKLKCFPAYEALMATTPDDDEDDYELELEAVDPEVLSHARERARRQVQETEARAERLETYDTPSEADAIGFDDFKSFRFTTRHLLVATAILAVLMSIIKIGGGCNGLFFAGLIMLAFGWWWVLSKERKERLERERRRLEIDARMAASRKHPRDKSLESNTRMAGLEPDEEDEFPQKPALTFSFSLKQVFWAFTIVALIMGLACLVSAEHASWMLGTIAVLGLAIHVMGFELPGIVVFGWWVLLVVYVIMSLFAIFMSGQGP
jgi:Flp pilus assembly protein TadB